ncbi:P-loop containing nucleoside triphosphate hydrolase protein [Russula brevipes]|nr:P-loop containing nucleoside triphosphate hydrolase protein [Russula brevipes]
MLSRPLASALLQKARLEDQSYNSDATREAMIQGLQKVFDGRNPYPWQLDAAEAILLGLDCIVVAGQMVIVISPLNALAFNQEIESRKYNVIIMSPEMCLGHIHLSSLLRNPKFMKYVMAIVIDEAHSVSEWGDNFRKSFAELGWLRSHVPASMDIPFYATSATLPPHILDDVIRRLDFSPSRTFFLNLGNDCLSVTHLVCRMRSKRDLEALDFIVEDALSGNPLTRTIVFFETPFLAQKGATHLRALLPDSLRPRVGFLTPGRSLNSINIVMGQFRSGSVDILCVTEAESMGLDIQDISRVVGFMVPRSLSIWIQQSGFAGRSGSPGIAILLVEPSVFQLKKSKKQNSNGYQNDMTTGEDQADIVEQEDDESIGDSNSDDDNSGDSDSDDSDSDDDQGWDTLKGPMLYDVDSRYKKRVEGGLRGWIDPNGHNCRRDVSREYFNNPQSQPVLTLAVPCCDLCILRKAADDHGSLTPVESKILALREKLSRDCPGQHGTQGSSGQVEDPIDIDAEPPRRGDRLQACQKALESWCLETFKRDYKHSVLFPKVVFPDKVIKKIASQARLKTLSDIKKEIPDWDWADDYGQSMLDLLASIDNSWTEESE